MIPRLLVPILTLLLAACTGTDVQFDPNKPHHGDGEFNSVKQGSFFAHYEMRKREGDPPIPSPDEIASIQTPANLDLIHSPAEQPRVTWIGHATSLVQYRGVNYPKE